MDPNKQFSYYPPAPYMMPGWDTANTPTNHTTWNTTITNQDNLQHGNTGHLGSASRQHMTHATADTSINLSSYQQTIPTFLSPSSDSMLSNWSQQTGYHAIRNDRQYTSQRYEPYFFSQTHHSSITRRNVPQATPPNPYSATQHPTATGSTHNTTPTQVYTPTRKGTKTTPEFNMDLSGDFFDTSTAFNMRHTKSAPLFKIDDIDAQMIVEQLRADPALYTLWHHSGASICDEIQQHMREFSQYVYSPVINHMNRYDFCPQNNRVFFLDRRTGNKLCNLIGRLLSADNTLFVNPIAMNTLRSLHYSLSVGSTFALYNTCVNQEQYNIVLAILNIARELQSPTPSMENINAYNEFTPLYPVPKRSDVNIVNDVLDNIGLYTIKQIQCFCLEQDLTSPNILEHGVPVNLDMKVCMKTFVHYIRNHKDKNYFPPLSDQPFPSQKKYNVPVATIRFLIDSTLMLCHATEIPAPTNEEHMMPSVYKFTFDQMIQLITKIKNVSGQRGLTVTGYTIMPKDIYKRISQFCKYLEAIVQDNTIINRDSQTWADISIIHYYVQLGERLGLERITLLESRVLSFQHVLYEMARAKKYKDGAFRFPIKSTPRTPSSEHPLPSINSHHIHLSQEDMLVFEPLGLRELCDSFFQLSNMNDVVNTAFHPGITIPLLVNAVHAHPNAKLAGKAIELSRHKWQKKPGAIYICLHEQEILKDILATITNNWKY